MKNPAQFDVSQRVHISLDVRDLEASLGFYQTLFGIEASKRRPDYAKLEPASPALNLALNRVSTPSGGETRVSHFGIQVQTPEEVRQAQRRLQQAGLLTASEDQVTCCYAVQDKVWVQDPDGNAWEVFAVTDQDAPVHSKGTSARTPSCCPQASKSSCC